MPPSRQLKSVYRNSFRIILWKATDRGRTASGTAAERFAPERLQYGFAAASGRARRWFWAFFLIFLGMVVGIWEKIAIFVVQFFGNDIRTP